MLHIHPMLVTSKQPIPISHTSIPSYTGSQAHQFPDSLSRARGVMLFNMAAVYCITRDTDKARRALQEVW